MMVLSHLVFDVREVRMGVMTMNNWTNNAAANCWTGSCLCKFEDFAPGCDKSFPLDQSAVQNSRNAILNKLNTNYSWSGCGTPLSGSMYAAANWFRSTSPEGFPAGWTTNATLSEPTSGGTTSRRSVCQACGFNAIIFITDGNPESDSLFTLPAGLTAAGYQVSDCVGSDCGNHMDEVAKWLWKLYRKDIPPVVSINEAIDLSKQYSNADAKRFINGILDRMKDKLGRDSRKPSTE